MNKISVIVESCLKECRCDADVRYDEPMANHCTFKAGGPADCWIRPFGENLPEFISALKKAAAAEKIPFFPLGGGANILVADSGIRGIILDTGGWTGETRNKRNEGIMEFCSGTNLDAAAETAAEAGLSGIEFLAGMPGSIGGAVWMNARCYGREIADVLLEAHIIDFSKAVPEYVLYPAKKAEFAYKHSPFQNLNAFILSAAFKLNPADTTDIRALMELFRNDRKDKGHYKYPSAGSVFKNNPDFGKPTGKIIDELGLRGLQRGAAQLAPWHGNIIINTGGATAADIRGLIDEIAQKVKTATSFTLEPEILFAGEW